MIVEGADRGRVWILEDSPLEAAVARKALTLTQDVELFTDGSVVLERVASGALLPDVIVLDWQLPGISGLEVCRVIRVGHDEMSLPILMLTSQGDKSNVVEALAAGANDYVVKPYDIAEVIARVGTLVRTSRLQRAQTRRTRQLALSADVGAAITKDGGMEEVTMRCAQAIAKHLDAPAAEIWAHHAGKLVLLASTTTGASSMPERVIRDVAGSQQAVVTDEPSAILAYGTCGPGACGFAALPLVVHDECHGVIAFCSRAPIGDALPVLMTIADLLALGMARARADEERVVVLERERSTRGDAEAANRSKDDFLAMVSHELRTPLNAITGWTGMLLGGTLDEARSKRALETIDRNARSQAQLIDDLLDISRIISGKLRVNVGSVDVPSTAEMALESVRLAADAKGIALDARIEPAAGQITGDADRLQQIIWNLLTNAIKFTPKGGRVVISVSRRASGIEIAIDDSGQGIATEFLPHVFERFKQADGTITRSKGGLGLGLAIVKHLVELHGGTIEAKSGGVGQGSSFVVLLPTPDDATDVARISSTLTSGQPALERPREIEGLRILVVDDDLDALELIRTLLESCKIVVKTASNAADAFQVLRTAKVDAMVSDIAMPDEDGLSLIRRVRMLSREEGGRTPAIALTAYARLEDRTKALRAGFNSHVAKPVEPSELLAVLASLTSG
jgi:signal transduction histidine kinase/DNA-binding response OmpR family regulator